MLTENQIAYENSTHWVFDDGKNAYEVFRNGITHSTKCATIGRSLGLAKAIHEADRRHSFIQDSLTNQKD